MSQQITIRIPDDLAEWLDKAESKTEVVTEALRQAYRRELHRRIQEEYERVPADTPDEWGDPVQFTETNRAILWEDEE